MSIIKFGKYEPCREVITIDKEHGNSMYHIYEFPNGYGASVVQNKCSKGNEDGLYQLAVMKNGVFCYSTPITNDFIGYLTADEVAEYLRKIEKLPDLQKEKITWNESE